MNLPYCDILRNLRIWDGDNNGSSIIDMGAYEYGAPTDIQVQDIAYIPQDFILYQNYPNPFNPRTVISYQLPVICDVELNIYNILGQKVAMLVSEKEPAGTHQVKWDASDFASGTYFIHLESGTFVKVRKCLLIK